MFDLLGHSILKAAELAEEVLGKETRATRKRWIDEKILQLIDERRIYKNARDVEGKAQYKRLRNEVQRIYIKARNNWLEGKCKKEKTLFRVGKVDTAHRKSRQNFRERQINANIVKGKNGKA